MNLLEKILERRFNSAPTVDPNAGFRKALLASPEVTREFLEYLSTEAARVLLEQRAASCANNPLALAYASGKHDAVMAMLSMTSIPKE